MRNLNKTYKITWSIYIEASTDLLQGWW